MNKKTWLFIGAILFFIISIILIYNLTKSDDLISKTKTVEGIKFSNAKIINDDGNYILYVTVTTSSKSTLKVEEFEANIYDKKGKRLETLTGYIGNIDKNSKKEITIESNEDLSKAYEINYTIRINND